MIQARGRRIGVALLALAGFLFAPAAHAQSCPSIEGKIGILFGGDLSDTEAMRPCYPDLVAVSKYDAAPLLDCFAGQIDRLIDPRKFIVAGHSTGAVHAEHLAQRVKNKSKVHLVLLEGYGSPLNQRGVETTCWYSRNGAMQGFNAGSMLDPKVCAGGANPFDAPWCKTNVCLHVSLVNLHAPEDLTRGTIGDAFKNCQGNRVWLSQ